MTIIEAINQVDGLKHNTYSQHDKVVWLSRLDGRIQRQIIDTHENPDGFYMGYDDETDVQTVLLAPPPYDEMYLRWLEAMIDYANGEYGKYNNSMLMFQTIYDDFSNDYNRNHMPKGVKHKYF